MPIRAEPPRAGVRREWTSRAYGLAVRGAFSAPGLPDDGDAGDRPVTSVVLAAPGQLDEDWPFSEAERVLEEGQEGRPPTRTIDRHSSAGYRLSARHFGVARISPGGEQVVCAPPGVAPWRWQRFLVGRVLPWAALLQGLELLHASSVRVGGAAAAFIAPTGGGKTSLATRLLLKGAEFVTDDVLALERRDEHILAHPGAALLSVRPEERRAVGPAALRQVGQPLGHSDKSYFAVERNSEPSQLRAIYLLVPRADGETRIDAVAVPDPRELLGSVFIVSVDSARRLAGLLHLVADIAAAVPVFRATAVRSAGAGALADAVSRHLESVPGFSA